MSQDTLPSRTTTTPYLAYADFDDNANVLPDDGKVPGVGKASTDGNRRRHTTRATSDI